MPLEARFEFSALPADGGNLPPHTDAPTKIVTMIVSILEDGEWDEAIGGGTDVNWPKDDTATFNQMNRVAGFDEMEVLDTYPFTPNQCVVFVKTFNAVGGRDLGVASEPQKDFATLIRAFALLRSRRDARLVILGDARSDAKDLAYDVEGGQRPCICWNARPSSWHAKPS